MASIYPLRRNGDRATARQDDQIARRTPLPGAGMTAIPTPGGLLISGGNARPRSSPPAPFQVTKVTDTSGGGDGTPAFKVAKGFVFTSSYTGDADSLPRHVPQINSTNIDTDPAPLLADPGGDSGDVYICLVAKYDMQTGMAKEQPWQIIAQDTEPTDTDIVRGDDTSGGVDGEYNILLWSTTDGQVVRNNIVASVEYDRLNVSG